ncbi:MAG: ArnT family glycosyltransferase [Candidatus Paceibacteria bacterium]
MKRIHQYGIIVVALGVIGIVASLILITPAFIASHVSPDGVLGHDTQLMIHRAQKLGLIGGLICMLIGIMAIFQTGKIRSVLKFTSKLPVIHTAILMVLLLVVFLNIRLWFLQGIISLTSRASLDYGEGFVLYFAEHWSHMYQTIDIAPYLVTNYPPVYPFLTGLLTSLFGDAFFAGRFVSIVSTLIIAIIIGYVLYRHSSSKELSYSARLMIPLFAGMLFLLSPITMKWGSVARVDALGVFFSVCAVYWYSSRRGMTQSIGCSLICVLAVFTKQLLIAAPLAIFLSWLYEKRYKDAAIFAALLAGISLFLMLTLIAMSDGQAFMHMLTYNINAYSFSRVKTLISFVSSSHVILLLLSMSGLIFSVINRVNIYAMYFMFALLISLTAGKIGASTNYYLESLASGALLSGYFMQQLGMRISIRNLKASVSNHPLVILIVVLLVWQYAAFVSPVNMPKPGSTQARSVINEAEGLVLSEDAGLLLATGHRITYQPFIMRQLIREDLWEQTPLVQSINNKTYSYIVLHNRAREESKLSHRWTKKQLTAIRNNYMMVSHNGDYWIYHPRSN